MKFLNYVCVFFLSCLSSVPAFGAISSSDLIVGSWLGEASGNVYVANFLQDGRYIEAAVVAGDAVHTGIEWGTYSWNPTNGAITATSLGDTNGDWGFSNDVNGTQYLTVSGNSGTVFQPGCASCTVPISRILPSSSPIYGSWLGEVGGNLFAGTFLPDGRYIEAAVISGDPTHTGIEWGTYSWNAATGAITAAALGDNNGDWGIANDVNGTQYLTVSGNKGTIFQPGCDGCTVAIDRILPAAVPIPATVWLFGSGLIGIIGMARRKLS